MANSVAVTHQICENYRNKMIYTICVLFCLAAFAHGEPELVRLEDRTPKQELRHLDTSLPQHLEFNLERESGAKINLRLEENRRLNANAPVFVTVQDGNQQRAVRTSAQPIEGVKFYQDRKNLAALQVSCANSPDGRCQRLVEGSLMIGEDSYEIKPAPDALGARGMGSDTSIPHLLEKVELEFNSHRNLGLGIIGASLKQTKEDGPEEHDHVPIPDARDASDHDHVPIPGDQNTEERLMEELRSLLNSKQLDNEIMSEREKRQAGTQYAVEVYIAVDPSFWKKYFSVTEPSNGTDKIETTKYVIRRKLAHVMNGVSLRYGIIDKSLLDVNITISGFIFYTTMSNYNPLLPSQEIFASEGYEYADGTDYIYGLVDWAKTLVGLRNDDHIMVVTSYDLYFEDNDGELNDRLIGIAFSNGICSNYRLSLVEDASYHSMTTVAAHELGHNLGANHDGSGNEANCSKDDGYIMAPVIASYNPYKAYSINPWRFSQCSVKAFVSFFKGVTCLSDDGDYYNFADWNQHNKTLPGEIYSAEQQCDLRYGSQSDLCELTADDERICRALGCTYPDNGYCVFNPAAQGTPCGKTSDKWCIDGLCQLRDGGERTTEACVDIGYYFLKCKTVSDLLWIFQRRRPTAWCSDKLWYNRCCNFCRVNGGR